MAFFFFFSPGKLRQVVHGQHFKGLPCTALNYCSEPDLQNPISHCMGTTPPASSVIFNGMFLESWHQASSSSLFPKPQFWGDASPHGQGGLLPVAPYVRLFQRAEGKSKAVSPTERQIGRNFEIKI